MAKVFSKLARAVRGIGRKHKTDREEKESQPNLLRLWPDGTWQIAMQGMSPHEWDGMARGILLETFNFDEKKAFHKEFGEGLGYRAASLDIPDDWVPSEKRLKKFWASQRYDTKFMYYMIARMQTLGHINA